MDHIDDLKRFLLKLPSDSEFNFNKNVRKQIREALFLAATDSGKYLSFMFPDVTGGGEPLIDRVDKEFEWLFANYYKSILSQRDPKFDTQYNHVFHGNLPCARIFRKGEPIYRCLTCGYDDTCALCSHCFHRKSCWS
jgi:Putative zinc finger in N-recognin (UBR box).